MFKFIIIVVFSLLVSLCFWLPYRLGKKRLGITVSVSLSLLVILSFTSDMPYLEALLVILLLFFCIVFVSYWALINLRFIKAARISLVVFGILAMLPVLSFALEDYFFFKSDAKTFLQDNEIVLQDKFKIKSNHIEGFTDLYQKFELEITTADKERIIKQLTSSSYYIGTVSESHHLPSKVESYITPKVTKDYKIGQNIVRESYQRLRQGYVSDHDIITVSESNNVLTFERFNE